MKTYLYALLSVGIMLSIVAAIYSVTGLTSIFKGAPVAILLMGGTLESCKVLISIYLHSFWKKGPKALLTYLTIALIILMFITSLGIYGYLSKAFATSTDTTGASVKIESLKTSLEIEQGKIKIAMDQISSINKTPAEEKTGWHYSRLRALSKDIEEYTSKLDKLNGEYAAEKAKVGLIESEVGPLKYLAKLVYGGEDKDSITNSVQLFIILIVIVFDPLAILSIIAAIWGLDKIKETVEVSAKDIEEIKESIKAEDEKIESLLHPKEEVIEEEKNEPSDESVVEGKVEETVADQVYNILKPKETEFLRKEPVIKEMNEEQVKVHENFLRKEIRDEDAVKKNDNEFLRKRKKEDEDLEKMYSHVPKIQKEWVEE